jgi:uncharacterized protein YydD (DUF2326 family)
MPVDFGRIPVQTIALFERCVNDVQEQVMKAVDATASEELKNYTFEKCLEYVLRDWRENDNTAGLEQKDIADLQSFVFTASRLAGEDLNGRGFAIYKATLESLLEDWLLNWNAEGSV